MTFIKISVENSFKFKMRIKTRVAFSQRIFHYNEKALFKVVGYVYMLTPLNLTESLTNRQKYQSTIESVIENSGTKTFITQGVSFGGGRLFFAGGIY